MIKINFRIIDLFTIIYFTTFVILISSTNNNTVKIALVMFCAWVLLAVLSNSKAAFYAFSGKHIIFIYLYMICIVFIGMISGRLLYNIQTAISVLLLFSPIILYNFYQQYNPKKSIQISKFFLIIWFIISLYSVYVYATIGDVGRAVTAKQYTGDEFALGGVTMANASVLVALYLLELLKRGKAGRKEKMFYIVIIAVQYLSVFMSGSTISTVCLIVVSVLVIIPQKRRLAGIFVLTLLLLIFLAFKTQIGQYIIQLSADITDDISANRISSLGHAIVYGSSNSEAGYFFDRIERPLLSLKTFLQHPVFGVAYQFGNYYPDAYTYGVGCHGEWADAMAKFGLFAFIYFSIFYKTIKTNCKINKISFPIWAFGWFLLGCFNPVLSIETTVISFFIIPGIDALYMENNKEKKFEDNIVY